MSVGLHYPADIVSCRVGAKYCTEVHFLSTCLYLSFKNVLLPKYVTKYSVLENKYIASTFRLVEKEYIFNLGEGPSYSSNSEDCLLIIIFPRMLCRPISPTVLQLSPGNFTGMLGCYDSAGSCPALNQHWVFDMDSINLLKVTFHN